ncbi:MAG: hypothetical protein KAI24_02020 [Planctomycetes bacterium]|nr:hypothetical protein [Planctomycetota bacterium]
MAHDDSELDRLSDLLRQCLGRIDEEAFRLQENEGETFDFGELDRLDDVTVDLQQLVDSMLVIESDSDEADVNAIVDRVTQDCLQDLAMPIVTRLSLCPEATAVAVPPSMLTVAVQRAIALVVDGLGPGDELALGTRIERDTVLLEIEGHGACTDETFDHRAATLQEFVDGFGGSCTARASREDLFLVLELPQVMATDRSDPA